MIRAEIIADSISEAGIRLTTFELTYPRVIHAELMTHRQFSRNASSSRAIPWSRMREWVLNDPYIPIHWGKNQKGMQATEELSEEDKALAVRDWLDARDDAVSWADKLVERGIHKQIVNRLVEPFGHINVVCSATGFENWYALRMHKAAMPEIQALAVAMARAQRASQPVLRPCSHGLLMSSWHLPYITYTERQELNPAVLPKVSAARCARVSYKTHDGKTPTLDEDIALFERLVLNCPAHASPTEHQAYSVNNSAQHRSGNFIGWHQFRKSIPGEVAGREFDWQARLVTYDGVDFIV